MERKTMGGFIAALRRSEGMTQKELADRLNVSDKSVSRWECDDGYPDISMIPVIAEIFGVTSDELLRGERKPADERATGNEKLGSKGKKELERLKVMAEKRFRSQSFLLVAIALSGLVTAAILNLGLLRAIIGFFAGSVFLIIALALEAMFLNSAISKGIEEDENTAFSQKIIRTAEASFAVMLSILGFMLPLSYLVKDSHLGLTGQSWLVHGSLCLLIALAVSLITIHFINGALVKKDRIALNADKKRMYLKIHRLKNLVCAGMFIALAITAILHVSTTRMWGPKSVMQGTTYTDLEEFKTLMETSVDYPDYRSSYYTAPPAEAATEEVIYYDGNGNRVSKEQAMLRTITGKTGKPVLSYVERNRSVLSVTYSFDKTGENLQSVTVYTYDDYNEGEKIIALRNRWFVIIYLLEIIASEAVFCLLKRKAKKS